MRIEKSGVGSVVLQTLECDGEGGESLRQHEWAQGDALVFVAQSETARPKALAAAIDASLVGTDVEVVSNDLMRDHHWQLVDSDALFLEWRDLHFTRYTFVYSGVDFELQLFRPRRSAGGLRLMAAGAVV